jgi:ubiquinone/menaquinone biosynthesis C-methylase UbiE
MRRLDDSPELLDGPLDTRTLDGNLRDLARVNRFLGGASLSWRAIQPLMSAAQDGKVLRVLDVGTGAADIPLSLAQRAIRHGRDLHFVATDVRPEIVAIARARAAESSISWVEVSLGQADHIDAFDGSFDVVHSSLVLHHLDPGPAIAALREMARVASRAVIVNDLDRTEAWYLGARLLALLTTTNPYTRNDGPLSVRRAYRPNEMRQLAARAGLVEEARYRARPGYRYALTFRHAAQG